MLQIASYIFSGQFYLEPYVIFLLLVLELLLGEI